MKRRLLTALAFLSVLSPLQAEVVPGELLVQFKDGEVATGRQAFIKKFATSASAIEEQGKFVRLTFSDNDKMKQEWSRLQNDPQVKNVQPNYRYRAFVAPSDTDYYLQWALNNTGQNVLSATYTTNNPGTVGMDIAMESAWNISSDCSDSIVAVIDTGVNYHSKELANTDASNMWDGTNCKSDSGALLGGCIHGYDFVDNDRDPIDFEGHGTHVAGVIAAQANNTGGKVAGICWTAKIMAVRVLGLDGATSASLARAINFARHNGAQVINMSLGGASEGLDAVLEQAMQEANDDGIFIVSAAGNDTLDVDQNAVVPCSLTGEGRICVAAVDQKFKLASFSNYGASTVQIAAPGTNILSTYHGADYKIFEDDFTSGWNLGANNWQAHDIGTCFIGAPYLISFPESYCQNDLYSGAYTSSSSKDYLALVKNYDFAYASYRLYVDIDQYALLTVAQSNSASVNFNDATQIRQQFTNADGRGDFDASLTGCSGSDHCSLGVKYESLSSSSAKGVAFGRLAIYGVQLSDSQYMLLNGTSMATPHVSAAVALARTLNPSLRIDQLYEALTSSGTVVSELSGKVTSGRVLNVDQLLRYIPAPEAIHALQIQ